MTRTSFGTLSMAAIFAIAAVLAPRHAFTAQKPSLEDFQSQSLEIHSQPIVLLASEPERKRFGKLDWLGGIELTSPSPYFGGLSGISLRPNGTHFVAVTDAGLWLTGELTYEGDQMAGFSDVAAGRLLGRGGKALDDEDDRDAEAVVWARDGRSVYVSFEHHHRIEQIAVADGSLGAPLGFRKLPATAARAHPNSGIEALGVIAKGPSAGALIAFSERQHDQSGNHKGWLIGKRSSKPIALVRLKGFDITDLTIAPDGDMFVLERRFRFSEGVQMRIRRVGAADIRPGATLHGEVLFEADSRFNIDNMEGIAVHISAQGTTVLTVVSDNNFNRFLQTTVMLQFAVPDQGRQSAQQ